MAKAHVEGSLGRLVVELADDADDADDAAVLDEVRSTVASVAADISWSKAEAARRRRRSPTRATRWRSWCRSPRRRWIWWPWVRRSPAG